MQTRDREEEPMPTPKIGTSRKVVIPDDVLDALHMIAAHRGETVSDTIRDALRVYVKKCHRGRRAA
jgi:metal-responsive CopG/Arc/MetJ family transcriptional regulator